MDTCLACVETRAFIGIGLFPTVEKEFNKCTANVIAFSRPDAWSHIDTDNDTAAHQRARAAWTE